MSYYNVLGDDDDLGDLEVLGNDDDLGDDDDVGALEVLGAYDILGAKKRRFRMGGKRKKSYARRLAASRGTVVRSQSAIASRRLTIGVDSGATPIAAGATATIVVQPVEPFRAELFAVDPTIAPSFLITSILVGRKSQLVGTGAVNAATFSAVNPLAAVTWDTAQTSQPISIAVLNNTGGALRFMATLFGTAVDVG